MSILNFYDKKRITITCSKTFFKNVLKNDISRCAKKAQKSFKKGYLTMLEEPAAHAGTAQTRISGDDTLSPGSRMNWRAPLRQSLGLLGPAYTSASRLMQFIIQ